MIAVEPVSCNQVLYIHEEISYRRAFCVAISVFIRSPYQSEFLKKDRDILIYHRTEQGQPVVSIQGSVIVCLIGSHFCPPKFRGVCFKCIHLFYYIQRDFLSFGVIKGVCHTNRFNADIGRCSTLNKDN